MPQPTHGMLVALTKEEILAEAKRAIPMVDALTLRMSLDLFLNICKANRVVLLRATADDYCTIIQRDAIGWSDDRP